MRDHRKLKAFELADNLAIEIYKMTAALPKTEQYGLTSQMRRAAVSVASNIVEGCARHTQTEYIRFLDIAYASCRELNYQIELTQRLSFITELKCKQAYSLCTECCKVLNGLLRSLRLDPQASSLRPQV